ncbi:nischarin [Eurytemora carolleeae]|uniref:nischarin n=1 Tax=Eurytemora carolleeae TaxID=1294199 RepID=UPI000C765EE0|nr:nischarin [Eurytemora carolleeae]|eukprot:XP_023335413.1 nischarin-like [Eurytemora affinis]
MFSISQRLKHPCPPSDPDSKRFDFTNVVDECCRLESLNVVGSNNNLGASNIVPNDLQFDFLAFKSLRKLVLENIRFDSEHITSLGILRNTLMELTIKESGVKTISEILLCDTAYNPADLNLSGAHMWPNLLCLDLSDNKITGLDRSIRYAPAIDTLVLDNNTIDSLDNLTGLPRLRRLSLVNNNLTITQDLHTVLGQITHIDLSRNNISSLHPFKKLYSLQDLNVSHNQVEDLDEVFIVCSLPCLDNLNLGHNKVNNKVDYRLKTLEAIGTRCREIRLDGEMATQAELDKVSVLMALRVTREKRCPTSLFGNLPNSEQWQL